MGLLVVFVAVLFVAVSVGIRTDYGPKLETRITIQSPILVNGQGTGTIVTEIEDAEAGMCYCYHYEVTSQMDYPIALKFDHTGDLDYITIKTIEERKIYQEDADTSELPALCKDGNWGTLDTLSGTYLVTYTIPDGAIAATLRLRDESSWIVCDEDIEFDGSDNVLLQIKSGEGLEGLYFNYEYEGEWVNLYAHDMGGYGFYEEAITWYYPIEECSCEMDETNSGNFEILSGETIDLCLCFELDEEIPEETELVIISQLVLSNM